MAEDPCCRSRDPGRYHCWSIGARLGSRGSTNPGARTRWSGLPALPRRSRDRRPAPQWPSVAPRRGWLRAHLGDRSSRWRRVPNRRLGAQSVLPRGGPLRHVARPRRACAEGCRAGRSARRGVDDRGRNGRRLRRHRPARVVLLGIGGQHVKSARDARRGSSSSSQRSASSWLARAAANVSTPY